MCLFAVEGGGFEHIPSGGLNGMATEQGQYALAAYFRFLDGQTSLYDMTDVQIGGDEPEVPPTGDSAVLFCGLLALVSVLGMGMVIGKRKHN